MAMKPQAGGFYNSGPRTIGSRKSLSLQHPGTADISGNYNTLYDVGLELELVGNGQIREMPEKYGIVPGSGNVTNYLHI